MRKRSRVVWTEGDSLYFEFMLERLKSKSARRGAPWWVWTLAITEVFCFLCAFSVESFPLGLVIAHMVIVPQVWFFASAIHFLGIRGYRMRMASAST